MIDTEHADQLIEMLTLAIHDMSMHGAACDHYDNGMRTHDILTGNLWIVRKLVEYANKPPTFSYFLHRSPHDIMFNGTTFATIDQLSIHT